MAQQSGTIVSEIEKPKAETRPFQEVYVSPKELKDFLKDESAEYGIDYQEIYNTINGVGDFPGESQFDENAYSPNKYGGSYGLAQYLRSTFNAYCKGDYINPFHQLRCMAQMFKMGMQSQWDAWCLQHEGNADCQRRGFR